VYGRVVDERPSARTHPGTVCAREAPSTFALGGFRMYIGGGIIGLILLILLILFLTGNL
jgi:hypothetical protein